ncbi:glycosyltransferase [Enterococcus hulanensis]|uniref:glycosyltransferase family 32 protein n=1 Tax=Enterococcus hulanensis TaxID=2559929 RepID=UPI0028918583|nr:glycosyltransferase [Enterococcus hulanensis]MDT2660058.1 glycosyltransferase [Enterococcus hulanensis]
MIPKIIHYVWFGRKQFPELTKKCMESWDKYCPDYKLVLWNEDNFDLDSCQFAREAYKEKKYAFVSDYVRLEVLYKYGGIYLDTDVELTKNLDEFLNLRAFSGFEDEKNIPTGIMGCEKENEVFKELLKYYNDRVFIKVDGTYDMVTNVKIITDQLSTKGFIPNNKLQVVEGFTLYPSDFFCPINPINGIVTITENTHAIHHFSGSWLSVEQREDLENRRKLVQRYGKEIGVFLFRVEKYITHPIQLIKFFLKRRPS